MQNTTPSSLGKVKYIGYIDVQHFGICHVFKSFIVDKNCIELGSILSKDGGLYTLCLID